MISVIIPTYNRSKAVIDCIDSVLASDYPSLEVIVVDDCSPDTTKEDIARRFGADSRVHYLRNERNSFQAVSRNRGASIARGEYLFFLDDDNVVEPTIFSELIKAFSERKDAALIAPLAIHQRPGLENLVWTLGSDFNRWTSQPHDSCPNLPLARLETELSSRGTRLLPTTYSPNAFCVRREVFEAIGGFDEAYVQIFEESDLGWRILKAGYRAYIAADARTRHFGYLEPKCSGRLRLLGIEKPYRTYCFARNRIKFARRHFSRLQALSVSWVFAPLSMVIYSAIALWERRPDIASAYCRGTLRGILLPSEKAKG